MEERSSGDNPVAHVRCGQCGSRIDVYHPALCSLNMTWLPEPPPSMSRRSHVRPAEAMPRFACMSLLQAGCGGVIRR
jgi:hypothetical protein